MRAIRLDVNWDCVGWVEKLAPMSQLAWVKLLCYARRSGAGGRVFALATKVAAKKWDVPVEAVAEMLDAALAAGAISVDGDFVVITEWAAIADHRPTMPPGLRQFVLQRDNWTCRYCQGPARTVDHVTPWSRGGSDEPENLVAACRSCNSAKHDRTPEEWLA